VILTKIGESAKVGGGGGGRWMDRDMSTRLKPYTSGGHSAKILVGSLILKGGGGRSEIGKDSLAGKLFIVSVVFVNKLVTLSI
jgi:hypothetical protein